MNPKRSDVEKYLSKAEIFHKHYGTHQLIEDCLSAMQEYADQELARRRPTAEEKVNYLSCHNQYREVSAAIDWVINFVRPEPEEFTKPGCYREDSQVRQERKGNPKDEATGVFWVRKGEYIIQTSEGDIKVTVPQEMKRNSVTITINPPQQ